MSGGLAQSVQVRLITHAQTIGQDPNLVLSRYAIERLLFRLSASPHADRFVLKGAFMLLVWLGESLRPTRDADVLGFGDLGADAIRSTFADICSMDVAPDGLTFDIDSIRVAPIRHEDAYGGRRVKLTARLGPARIPLQIDIGVGDAVFPRPEWIYYPTLLGMPQPRIRAYQKETAIAEKVHAMITLGSQNSRLRDFFDVHALASRESFDGATLATAVQMTFERRRTKIPSETPIAFTPEFAELDGKRLQWTGFLKRSRLPHANFPLETAIVLVSSFAGPIIAGLAAGTTFTGSWPRGGPWHP